MFMEVAAETVHRSGLQTMGACHDQLCMQRVLRQGTAARGIGMQMTSVDPAFLDLRLDDEHWAVRALTRRPAQSVKRASDWRLDDRES